MKVLLILIALWSSGTYGNPQATPVQIFEVENMATCKAAGEAVIALTKDQKGARYACIGAQQ